MSLRVRTMTVAALVLVALVGSFCTAVNHGPAVAGVVLAGLVTGVVALHTRWRITGKVLLAAAGGWWGTAIAVADPMAAVAASVSAGLAVLAGAAVLAHRLEVAVARGDKHILYRFFDETSTLLYVGITNNPRRRFSQHAESKPWWTDVARVDREFYPSRVELEAAERQAIRSERPRYNIAHAGAR